ncbi:hypothetical protein QWZ10_20030 [Paracoccus cavernae]|uniref:Uncharacterized protein n=1 Tax=Paracoccus cavernae TaxID=1571207 RepID=A0ABT8D9K1_9RHOB|nr:hypothetical protein [Paracoccus cavernae]
MTEIREFWAMILAAIGFVAWLVRLEARVNANAKEVLRHEERLRGLEAAQHQQAIGAAETREAIKSIKLTVDRIYAQISAQGRVTHWDDKTSPPR